MEMANLTFQLGAALVVRFASPRRDWRFRGLRQAITAATGRESGSWSRIEKALCHSARGLRLGARLMRSLGEEQ